MEDIPEEYELGDVPNGLHNSGHPYGTGYFEAVIHKDTTPVHVLEAVELALRDRRIALDKDNPA